jgi:hypothetical protein
MAIIARNRCGSYRSALNQVEIPVRNYLWLVMILRHLAGTCGYSRTEWKGSVDESTLPPIDAWNVLRSNLSIVERVANFPRDVRTAIAKALHQDELEMGDRATLGPVAPFAA